MKNEWISEGRSENRSTALTKRLCESQNRVWISKTVRDMTMILFSSYRSSQGGGIESANHFFIRRLDFSLALHKVRVFENVEGGGNIAKLRLQNVLLREYQIKKTAICVRLGF